MSSSEPSAADQQLIDHAQRHGYTVTAKQLATWRPAGLMPGNIPGGGLGRGKGSTSRPAPESFDLVLGLARHAGPGKRPTDSALLLFAEGLPVPETTVRAAFRAAVDTITLPGDDDPAEDLDERLNNLAGQLAETGQAMTLVPARARRIDEHIARLARDAGEAWPPAELAVWDGNPEPAPSTPQGATLTAAAAVLTLGWPSGDCCPVRRHSKAASPSNGAAPGRNPHADCPSTSSTGPSWSSSRPHHGTGPVWIPPGRPPSPRRPPAWSPTSPPICAAADGTPTPSAAASARFAS